MRSSWSLRRVSFKRHLVDFHDACAFCLANARKPTGFTVRTSPDLAKHGCFHRNFQLFCALWMVSLNSASVGSIKEIPPNILALSSSFRLFMTPCNLMHVSLDKVYHLSLTTHWFAWCESGCYDSSWLMIPYIAAQSEFLLSRNIVSLSISASESLLWAMRPPWRALRPSLSR